MKDRSRDRAMAEVSRRDPGYTVELLNSILGDGDRGELLIVLRQMTNAFDGVHSVTRSAGLSPSQLYRTLSGKGNPGVRNLTATLRTMGLRLAIQPLHPATASHQHMSGGRIMRTPINVLVILSGTAGVAILGLGVLRDIDWPLQTVVLGDVTCVGMAVVCVLATVLMEVPAGA